jgi:hypothetical protein
VPQKNPLGNEASGETSNGVCLLEAGAVPALDEALQLERNAGRVATAPALSTDCRNLRRVGRKWNPDSFDFAVRQNPSASALLDER